MVKIRDNVKKNLLGSNSSIFSSTLLLSQAPPPSGLSGIYVCDESIESFAVIDLPQLLLVIIALDRLQRTTPIFVFFK
ncbi:hypothetical protein [Winogradskyella sp. UBA3174]|uniref:hypothetical protein n=1 Tax=Winogradskyella sp. UBA3174 TaxID=1947785 RepID=UPI0025DEB95C|nr:hypothetical protein [Winogradskyella sp. UBA3174]|tara:strand:- start:20650 stop:20883 length:234 start_codon:yes stop_codon:yes gene_type:complete